MFFFPFIAAGSNTTGQPEGGPDSRTVFVSNVSVPLLFRYVHIAEDLDFTSCFSVSFRYILVHQKMLFLVTSICLERS